MQKHATRPPTYTLTAINAKWIIDLNVSLKTIKTLEENIGSKISDISQSNIFANVSLRTRETKRKINNETMSN